MEDQKPDDFKRELGLLDGTMLVVGSMIYAHAYFTFSQFYHNIGKQDYKNCNNQKNRNPILIQYCIILYLKFI